MVQKKGQKDAKWRLCSSLSRHLKDFVPNKELWQEREPRAIRIFRRKAHNYLPDASILEDDFTQVGRFLDQMHGTEDMAAVAPQGFERVEEQETW
jgi:hypothetical protein